MFDMFSQSNVAYLTDELIEAEARAAAEKIRDDLRAQRQQARDIMAREAAEKIEAQYSDAGKADPYPPHASPFPTEAQAALVNRNVGLSLAVSGDMMAGKTSLLLFLLEAMADAGLLSVADTKTISIDPFRYLSMKRSTNDAHVEVIDIDLDLDALLVESGIVEAMRPKQSLLGDFTIDAALAEMTGWGREVRAGVEAILRHPGIDLAEEIVLTFRKV